jgi:ligand-binding sensor domain-containing protein
MKKIFIYLLTFLPFLAFAQNDLKIGQWKSYLSYRYAKYVTQSNDKIFYATEMAILSLDKRNDEIEFLSKVEGLSDAGVQLIKYNKFAEILLVAYNNGNIDLVKKDGTVQNVRDILDNITIIGDKKIYDVYVENASNVYLACGFGIVKFNMLKGEFDFTTFTNSLVKNIEIHDGFLFAIVSGKLYRTKNDAQINLADFKNWQLLGKTQGFSNNYACKGICSARGKLYLGINDTLCVWQNNNLKKMLNPVSNDHTVGEISAEGKNILVNMIFKDQSRTWDARLFSIDENESIKQVNNNGCFQYIYNAIEDEKGQVWMSEYSDPGINNGFKRLQSVDQPTCKTFKTNTPFSNSASEIAIADDNSLWVAGGSVFNGVYQVNYDGFYRYFNGKWSYKNESNDPIIKDSFLYKIHDLHTVAINNTTKKTYIGSFWGGLLEVDENGKILNHFKAGDKKSTLDNAQGDLSSVRIGGLAFDKKGNLWIANNKAKKSISVLTAEGKWYSMGKNMGDKLIYQCVVDPINSYKWFAMTVGDGGVLVYDEGKDIASEDDDRFMILNTTNSKLPSNRVNCLEVDLDGRVWVGTDNGVVYFSCGSSLFTKQESCKGFLPISVVDGIPEFLLKYNNINTIAVDGANRKWFGTTNGFFVQSPDGREQIAYYNSENSPLFDDNILDIAINNRTGEVYISTSKGIQSFKTDALKGASYQGNVSVYPNPIRPDYEGSIAIKGLAEDSKVKITDINGKLVYEMEALGGQAIWDGKDYNGRKAETGVYFVFAAYTKDIDYPSEAVTKLLIVK